MNCKTPFVVVVVDDDVADDNRVRRSIEDFIGTHFVFDIRLSFFSLSKLFPFIFFSFPLLASILRSVKKLGVLRKKLVYRVDKRFFSGLTGCLGLLYKAMLSSVEIKSYFHLNDYVTSLSAHDLYCGVAAALAKGKRKIAFTYDAHELEIHRNRKAGWLRVLIEHGLEQFVLSRCTELVVVNAAIRDVMDEWYELPENIRIVYNDFYAHHDVLSTPPLNSQPSIVYVGKGVNGRALEYLDNTEVINLFHVNVFLLGSRLPAHIQGADWRYGPDDYEESLVSLSKIRRCMMWCCLEKKSLSYELATPNKFFQALAVGMPIIASEGTYLATIVLMNGIGVVFSGDNFEQIRHDVTSDKYEKWVENVLAFRSRLKSGEVVI